MACEQVYTNIRKFKEGPGAATRRTTFVCVPLVLDTLFGRVCILIPLSLHPTTLPYTAA